MPQQPMSPFFKQLIGYCRNYYVPLFEYMPLFRHNTAFCESGINQKSTSEEKTWDVLSDY